MSITLHTWLAEHPYTLAMSSGFFSFFAHCGMLTALIESKLPPAAISGSSAGALVGATWASGCNVETLRDVIFGLKRADFWDPSPGFGLLRGGRLRAILDDLCPAPNLENCHVPVTISVFDLLARRTEVLDKGPLTPAIYATCAVPLMFQPIRINGRWYADGGIADRPGLTGVQEGKRTLYHHITSRSPWSNKARMQIPRRANLAALAVNGLPRVGPGRLELGPTAFHQTRAATLHALQQPLTELIQIEASENL